MPLDNIVVKGAREHNLKNIDVVIPRGELVVITGVSGSGKSSLAFDTIYAEGQRRYVESLSAYARQFLGLMEKPDVDYIDGLSPAISIDQKGVSHNPRSTVGTVTEVYDYLRLLFARIGQPHCHNCGRPVQKQTIQQIVDAVMALPEGTRIMVLGPLIQDRKGEFKDLFEDARKGGYVRVRVDGQVHDLAEVPELDKKLRHSVEIVVDRLVIGDSAEQSRVTDSVETALKLGAGIVLIVDFDSAAEHLFSEHFACMHCGISFPEIEPRTFSFNSPHGACPACTGLGVKLEVDPDLVVVNKDLSISEGAITAWSRAGTSSGWYSSILESLALQYDFSTRTKWANLSPDLQKMVLYGTGDKPLRVRHRTHLGREFSWETTYEGVVSNLERRYRETESDYTRSELERYMSARPCPSCLGKRLKPESRSVLIDGKNIIQVTEQSIDRAVLWVKRLQGEGPSDNGRHSVLTEREQTIGNQILKEILGRLRFLEDIGLDYLSLARQASTLSGGEAQRIRLATQIGSGLMGVLYVCDEPSIGLHPIDNHLLIETLKRLRDLGNTVLIVEHDEAIMRASDQIIDLGPGAGEHGGTVIAQGTVEEVSQAPKSITGAYLSGRTRIAVPEERRQGNGNWLTVKGARENNLSGVDVAFPLGRLVCVTGVSGSGKSSLVYEVLYKKLAQVLNRARERPGASDGIEGIEHIDKIVNIDQSPIGRTPRSNPATYVGAFTPIRELFAAVPESRMRGYKAGRFSFNVKGGRCEACGGGGYVQIEMQFLPNVEVPCEVCRGKRYNREALEITFKDKNISEVLNMTVEEALEFFEPFNKIRPKLETMRDVGLGYIRLGQPATTLSGGEAQRIKLSTELSRRATGKTLYILDEPTTGLSFSDSAALLRVLHRLVDTGNTVVLIEHHLDLIKNADWIIDLGPGAGDSGGRVIAQGTPEQVARVEGSATALYLKELVKAEEVKPPAAKRRRAKSAAPA